MDDVDGRVTEFLGKFICGEKQRGMNGNLIFGLKRFMPVCGKLEKVWKERH